MRVSTNMSLDNFAFQQQKLLSSLVAEQLHLSTGQAVLHPSDSPTEASRLLKLTEIEESQQQILENIRFAGDFMNAADAALTDVSDALIRVQELASGAVSSIALPAEREAAAIEIDSILQQLVSTANRQYLGLYLFGGRHIDIPPVRSDLDGIRYVGDTGALQSRLAIDGTDQYNLTAHEVFGMLSQRVRGTVDLDPAVTADTRLDELLGADRFGIRPGSLRISEDGAAGSYTVDLTTVTTVGQIIDAINAAAQAAGSGLTASLNTQGNGIRIDPADAVTISAVDNGALASDLGIVTDVATTAAVEGRDLNRLVMHNTRLSDLAGGAGIDVSEPILIVNGSHRASIDLSPAVTVQDVVNAVNHADIGVRAMINADGTGLDVLNEISGSLMSITEDGGTTAAALGLRTLDTVTRLEDLNFGQGVRILEGQDDLQIVARDGAAFTVNLDGAETIQDVLDLINAAAADAGAGIEAALSATTSALVIRDTTAGSGALQVTTANFSEAVQDLGLDVVGDPDADEVVGEDPAAIRVDGVFSALIELRDALLQGDELLITETAGRVDSAQKDITRMRGLLGAEVRAVETRGEQTQQAVDATNILLSQVRDLDFAEAISKFQQTQTALQASLLASGQSLNLSLLNFLS